MSKAGSQTPSLATRGRALRRRSGAASRRLASSVAAAIVSVGVIAVPAYQARAAGDETVAVGPSNGPGLVRLFGPRAAVTLAPNTGLVGALVALPKGVRARDLGLDEVAPGIGRLRGKPERIAAFGLAHPELRVEVAPPLHLLLDRVGQWVASTTARLERGVDGRGVFIGVADTGIDVVHPDFIDKTGHSRVAWLLDLSLAPLGVHADLEDKFGIKDDTGKVVLGAVLDDEMIDARLATMRSGSCAERGSSLCAPTDEIGHGTHVAGIAASSVQSKYPGMAPGANLVFVRLPRAGSGGIDNDDLMRAVPFMFDRADAEGKPIAVNLSLGSDFGPHDGTFLWEQVIASYVGPDHPGRAIVAAAGNSGSIAEMPIHQSVSVTKGAITRVPIRTFGADAGRVQIWITLRDGADLSIGLDGPDGEWIAPVSQGHQNGKNTADFNAGVIYGDVPESPIPKGSRGAVIAWTGHWPEGTYAVTLKGQGMAELYLEGFGDVAIGSKRPATFVSGVREGTINMPATHPAIIGVGCTINRARWTSISGAEFGLGVPLLDAVGGLPLMAGGTWRSREVDEGEVCWFSSAGPTATGIPKPDISAPGGFVVSAMSRGASPGSPLSMFTMSGCPDDKSGRPDARCLQIDDHHGIGAGTSMSSPVVAGVVALLLQEDPTLTQDDVRALLQGGAHRFRGASPFQDQSGPGEVDAMGALDALDQMRSPTLRLPSLERSWLSLSSDYVPADGSTAITAIVELRTADGKHRADMFDPRRLVAVVTVDGAPVATTPAIVRRGPGVWYYTWKPEAGLGGSRVSFGATFDGVPIVAARTVPIATDGWNASYPSRASGSGCAVSRERSSSRVATFFIAGSALAIALRKRARRPTHCRSRSSTS